MDIHRVGTYLTPLESWEGAEHCPVDRIGIGHPVVEESGVESKSASIGTGVRREANSMDIHRVGTYLTPLESWEGAEQCPVDRIGIGHLVVEESGIESKSASIDTSLITEANSMDIHRVGTYLIPLESWEGAEHCPVDRIGMRCLVVEESGVESKSASIDTRLIRDAKSMDIHRVE